MEQKEFSCIKDIQGTEIKVGDTIALATRVGNSAELKIRLVKGFKKADYSWNMDVQVENPETGRCAWANPRKMLVVKV